MRKVIVERVLSVKKGGKGDYLPITICFFVANFSARQIGQDGNSGSLIYELSNRNQASNAQFIHLLLMLIQTTTTTSERENKSNGIEFNRATKHNSSLLGLLKYRLYTRDKKQIQLMWCRDETI